MTITYTSFTESGGMVLPPNKSMAAGQFLASQSGRFHLRLKLDGNLVLEDEGTEIWIADNKQPYSNTFYRKRMREPLQFVVSNSAFLFDPSRNRLWSATSTETTDKSYWYHNHLMLTDTGNIVIYDGRNGEVRWARLGFAPGRLPPPKLIGHVYHEPSPLYSWAHALFQ